LAAISHSPVWKKPPHEHFVKHWNFACFGQGMPWVRSSSSVQREREIRLGQFSGRQMRSREKRPLPDAVGKRRILQLVVFGAMTASPNSDGYDDQDS